ncbi:hypothetical protein PSFL_24800 [Pseudomonas sp. DD1]
MRPAQCIVGLLNDYGASGHLGEPPEHIVLKLAGLAVGGSLLQQAPARGIAILRGQDVAVGGLDILFRTAVGIHNELMDQAIGLGTCHRTGNRVMPVGARRMARHLNPSRHIQLCVISQGLANPTGGNHGERFHLSGLVLPGRGLPRCPTRLAGHSAEAIVGTGPQPFIVDRKSTGQFTAGAGGVIRFTQPMRSAIYWFLKGRQHPVEHVIGQLSGRFIDIHCRHAAPQAIVGIRRQLHFIIVGIQALHLHWLVMRIEIGQQPFTSNHALLRKIEPRVILVDDNTAVGVGDAAGVAPLTVGVDAAQRALPVGHVVALDHFHSLPKRVITPSAGDSLLARADQLCFGHLASGTVVVGNRLVTLRVRGNQMGTLILFGKMVSVLPRRFLRRSKSYGFCGQPAIDVVRQAHRAAAISR